MKLTNLTILDAIKDDRLFGKAFRKRLFRGDSWFAWRAFLCSLFAIPFESDAAFQLYKQCSGRSTLPTVPFKEVFVCAGRRSGKSFVCALIAVYCACFRDYAPFLSAGEVPVVAVLAASRDQAQILMRYIKAFLKLSPVLSQMVSSEGKDFIELKSGLRIEILTSDFKTLRGRTVVIGLIDEQAHLDPSTDAELLAALRPSQITIENSLLIGLSTPWRRAGSFFREVTDNHGRDDSLTMAWRAPSRLMNPTITSTSIALAFVRDEVSARTELLAEFRSDLESYLSAENIAAVTVTGRQELPRVKGVQYRGFCDVSGGKVDAATLCVAHADDDGVAILDAIRVVNAPHNPQDACRSFAETLKAYGVFSVVGDRYSAGFVETEFGTNGISYEQSERDRSQLYSEFLPLVTSKRCELLDHKVLQSQLIALERKVGAGRDRIDHAPSGHDDVANSCAGAAVLVAGGAGDFGVLDMHRSGMFARIQGTIAESAQYVVRNVFGKTIPNPRDQNLDKKQLYPLEAAALGLDVAKVNPQTAAAWELPPVDPCPKCKATIVILVGGGQAHCNACGAQWWPSDVVPEVVYAARGGLVARRLQ